MKKVMNDKKNAQCEEVKALYTELAIHPDKDFGWSKGKENAASLGYDKKWLEQLPNEVWESSAAVGNPFSLGLIHSGDTVVDLGCGAGADLCVASLLAGENGEVIGIDFTAAMVEKAKQNARLAGLTNITVYESSIEKLPLESSSVDTIISNGAINISSSKESVFSEIYRVLKDGGNLYFADMIKDEKNECQSSCSSGSSESWADCVAGTLKAEDVIQLMEEAGFSNIEQVSITHYKTSDSTSGAMFRAIKKAKK